MKGCDSYSSGTKETWRGWVWNRIVERLPGFHPKMGPAARRELARDKTVIYLAGTDDNDRNFALRHGFQPHNLIAVDVDAQRVKSVRMHGGIAINETIQATIAAWPKDIPIDVVVADLCSNFSNPVILLANAMISSPLHCQSVVAINLLAGLEHNEYYTWAKNNPGVRILCSNVGKNGHGRLHRGMVLFQCLLIEMLNTYCSDPLDDPKVIEILGHQQQRACIAQTSYVSPESGQSMDTVVFRWPSNPLIDSVPIGSMLPFLTYSCKPSKNIKGKISALKAVRTMKLAISGNS